MAGFKSRRITHLSRTQKFFTAARASGTGARRGTHHAPGIQPADVQELIEHGAKAIVLSKGIWERLNVCPETLEVLAKNDLKAEVFQTEAAVERFNGVREIMPVGGLFHSTC